MFSRPFLSIVHLVDIVYFKRKRLFNLQGKAIDFSGHNDDNLLIIFE